MHHDIWDYDLGAAPTLIDVRRDGKTIPAVAQITKMGMLFIFNRVTGEPIFGIEERPGAAEHRARREDVADAAVPAQAAAAGAQLDEESRAADERSRRSTPPTAKALWEKYKLAGLRALHPWRVGPGHRRVPRRDRRRQLGRRRRSTRSSV